MIRDPSDGSVKPPPKPQVSGLADENPKSTDEAERLEQSRQWLKDYAQKNFKH